MSLLADLLDGTDERPRFTSPGELARVVDPRTVQTPALDLIDRLLVDAWRTRNARLIISMPPQEGKSSRVTQVGSLWALTEHPDTRIGVVSYAQSLAEGFGRTIRNWVTTFNGDEGTLDLGLRVSRDNGSVRRWSLAGHRGGVVCAGIGSGLTGRPLDALIIDDPFADAEQAESDYYRERVWDWWQAVGSTRLAPGAPVIVILTRWHEDDLAGRLLAAEDGGIWQVVNIPALADHRPECGETDLLGRQPGQWLISARGRSVAEWEAIRLRAGSRVFNALYQGRPSPDVGSVWQRGWWRRYHAPEWSVTSGVYQTTGFDELIQSWDMTFKDTAGSDYVVGMVLGRRGLTVYVLDEVRARMSFTETLASFTRMCAKWPQTSAKLVEDKANGTAVIDTLRRRIPGIIPVTPTESKHARAAAVAPYVESGNVLLPAGEIALFDVGTLIDESAAFPNGAHDDQVDALSQALRRLLLTGGQGSAFLEHWRARGVPAQHRDWRADLTRHRSPQEAT